MRIDIDGVSTQNIRDQFGKQISDERFGTHVGTAGSQQHRLAVDLQPGWVACAVHGPEGGGAGIR
jgi:hypothetical protein